MYFTACSVGTINWFQQVNTRWVSTQFNKIEKSWVQVEIICLYFPKTCGNRYITSRKVTTIDKCEVFSNLFLFLIRTKLRLPQGVAIIIKMYLLLIYCTNVIKSIEMTPNSKHRTNRRYRETRNKYYFSKRLGRKGRPL